jgi:hypothetical protein
MDANKDEEEATVTGVDFSAFTKSGGTTFKDDAEKKSRSSSKKKMSVAFKGEVLPDRPVENNPGYPTQGGYFTSFAKTNAMLETAIADTDLLNAEVKEDINTIRNSKTLKNKYTYITNLTSSSASLIAAKISAIKEIDGNISQAHKLELDRLKSIRDSEKEQNDDGRMMDLYKAFVNTPVGTYTSPNVPSIGDMTTASNNILGISMGDVPDSNNLTPEQARMRMENNPNIMTVVKFNQSTGQRFFDVVDRTTMASIPNYPRPDPFLLDDTNIDIHSMSARNKNLDTVWPLVLIGDGDLSEY